MEKRRQTLTRENELARLIFAAHDLSAVRRLQQYLSRHPDLWQTLSAPLRQAVESVILDAFFAECPVNGPAGFSCT